MSIRGRKVNKLLKQCYKVLRAGDKVAARELLDQINTRIGELASSEPTQ